MSMHTDRMPLPSDAAELLGLQVLGWIAGDPGRVAAFMGAGGATPQDLRARADDPEFLGFVLDFLLADETTLLAFCGAMGVPPDRPARARAALPGGDVPQWT